MYVMKICVFLKSGCICKYNKYVKYVLKYSINCLVGTHRKALLSLELEGCDDVQTLLILFICLLFLLS